MAEMMFMPRFLSVLICVMSFRLLVPAVETMVLPFRSFSVLMFDDFFDTQRLAGMKCVLVKATCCWRSTRSAPA